MAASRKTKKTTRGAKAPRSSFRAAKPKPKAKPKAKAKAKPKAKKPARTATIKRTAEGVVLGEITVPSGRLAIFDIGLCGFLPLEALDPAIVKVDVPADRALRVLGTRVGKGRFAQCWDHVCVELAPGEPHHTQKLGEAGVDLARLACMDHAALEHWVHEDTLDGKADFVFWGRDAAALARVVNAKRVDEGYGWLDLPVAQAEAKADEAARKKSANKWLLATDFRPHSHHYQVLAAARASANGAGTLELAGTRLLVFFTSWGDGVFPIYLDRDSEDRPVRVRIQLATPESSSAMAAVNP